MYSSTAFGEFPVFSGAEPGTREFSVIWLYLCIELRITKDHFRVKGWILTPALEDLLGLRWTSSSSTAYVVGLARS